MFLRCLLVCLAMASTRTGTKAPAVSQGRIEIYPANPAYWQYKGRPLLLIGGSRDENLFQIPDLVEHLDLLKAVGGNYVRNTMNVRIGRDFEVQPFKELGDGRYDLGEWNTEYWRRFEEFLTLTQERDIIVQIEIWATFNYYRQDWGINPFNPRNNINYRSAETGLPVGVISHPVQTANNFFWSVPEAGNRRIVLDYQQRFVAKILSYSLGYGNVLYCMDNETSVTPEWGWYWSRYIQEQAARVGVSVHTTEMWDPWNLADPMHDATFDHPEIYSFVEISQNNHQKGQTHWDNIKKRVGRMAGRRRPLNNVKIYGADTGSYGSDRDGIERFWRSIFAGSASVRFHRPEAGLGLSRPAQASIRSAARLTEAMNIFDCAPHNDLLTGRESNEAYCLANPGLEYAVYFPDGGRVVLNANSNEADATIRWLDISQSTWRMPEKVSAPGRLVLECPSGRHWVALVQ